MADLPLDILTDAGFTTEEANSIVEGLVHGTNLHRESSDPGTVNIDELSPEKQEALDRFNVAVAGDA